jgi:hypothetical protein
MHVVSHFLAGWAGSLPLDMDSRDRGLIAFASVSPDLDGLVVIADLAQGRPLDGCELYAACHHVLCHNVLFAVVASLAFGCLARRKLAVGLMSLLAIAFHFVTDLVGSAGPDGSVWGIHLLFPLSGSGFLEVPWQWALNAWPNIGFTVGLLALSLHWAWKHGTSPVGVFSARADRALVMTLRRRFGEPAMEP